MYRVDEWQGDSVHRRLQLKEVRLTMNLDHNKQPLPVIPCVKLTNIFTEHSYLISNLIQNAISIILILLINTFLIYELN